MTPVVAGVGPKVRLTFGRIDGGREYNAVDNRNERSEETPPLQTNDGSGDDDGSDNDDGKFGVSAAVFAGFAVSAHLSQSF